MIRKCYTKYYLVLVSSIVIIQLILVFQISTKECDCTSNKKTSTIFDIFKFWKSKPLVEVLPPSAVQRGSFWVLENYIEATHIFKYNETITYTTHGEYSYLDNLIPLAAKWQGPISVAVYAPGNDFQIAIETIFNIRNCSEDVQKYATFHLFFSITHFPKLIPRLNDLRNFNIRCNAKNFTVPKTSYRISNHLLYPVNVARNIARKNAATYYVLASDIELYPSQNVIPEFFKMLQNSDFSDSTNRRVYVLPVFEILKNQRPPNKKSELKDMLRRGTAFVFHQRICSGCHLVPRYMSWKNRRITAGLSVHTIGKRKGRNISWEPFYIGTNDEPIFDERLSTEGRANKLIQAYAMCLIDYEYHVLDNAFLIHKPGIKLPKKKVLMNDIVAQQNDLIFNVIVKEYQILFGVDKECEVFGRPKVSKMTIS